MLFKKNYITVKNYTRIYRPTSLSDTKVAHCGFFFKLFPSCTFTLTAYPVEACRVKVSSE